MVTAGKILGVNYWCNAHNIKMFYNNSAHRFVLYSKGSKFVARIKKFKTL